MGKSLSSVFFMCVTRMGLRHLSGPQGSWYTYSAKCGTYHGQAVKCSVNIVVNNWTVSKYTKNSPSSCSAICLECSCSSSIDRETPTFSSGTTSSRSLSLLIYSRGGSLLWDITVPAPPNVPSHPREFLGLKLSLALSTAQEEPWEVGLRRQAE